MTQPPPEPPEPAGNLPLDQQPPDTTEQPPDSAHRLPDSAERPPVVAYQPSDSGELPPDTTQPITVGRPAGKGLRRVLAATALVVLTALGVGLYVFLAGREEREVRSVADSFVTAVDTADEARIVGLLCPEEAADITGNENLLPPETSSDLAPDASTAAADPAFAREITDIEVADDVASARVVRPDQEPFTLYLRKDASGWKICAPAEERFPRPS